MGMGIPISMGIPWEWDGNQKSSSRTPLALIVLKEDNNNNNNNRMLRGKRSRGIQTYPSCQASAIHCGTFRSVWRDYESIHVVGELPTTR